MDKTQRLAILRGILTEHKDQPQQVKIAYVKDKMREWELCYSTMRHYLYLLEL